MLRGSGRRGGFGGAGAALPALGTGRPRPSILCGAAGPGPRGSGSASLGSAPGPGSAGDAAVCGSPSPEKRRAELRLGGADPRGSPGRPLLPPGAVTLLRGGSGPRGSRFGEAVPRGSELRRLPSLRAPSPCPGRAFSCSAVLFGGRQRFAERRAGRGFGSAMTARSRSFAGTRSARGPRV